MPCTWPVDRSCLPDVDAELDIARMQEAIDTAVAILWAFTGRQFGQCPRIVRPCPQRDTNDAWWAPGWSWYVELAVWDNTPCGCGPRCRVGGPGVVHLPGPVHSITAVTVGDSVLASTAYRLEGDRLYAMSGRWPSQNLERPAGEPGTWSVEYLSGLEPPAGAALMVGKLALEFWNACTGGKCRLPPRVESVVRQGVSMKMADPAVLFEDRRTGIREIDLWILAHNPHQMTAPSSVSSPDYPGGV
jgi:hypothetical protein